jgi:hypothetical protein
MSAIDKENRALKMRVAALEAASKRHKEQERAARAERRNQKRAEDDLHRRSKMCIGRAEALESQIELVSNDIDEQWESLHVAEEAFRNEQKDAHAALEAKITEIAKEKVDLATEKARFGHVMADFYLEKAIHDRGVHALEASMQEADDHYAACDVDISRREDALRLEKAAFADEVALQNTGVRLEREALADHIMLHNVKTRDLLMENMAFDSQRAAYDLAFEARQHCAGEQAVMLEHEAINNDHNVRIIYKRHLREQEEAFLAKVAAHRAKEAQMERDVANLEAKKAELAKQIAEHEAAVRHELDGEEL